VIERREAEASTRAEALAILSVFGKLAYPSLDVLGIIGREKMKESKFFEEVMALGRQEAEVANGRAHTLVVLEERFGPSVAAEFAPAVNALDDAERLNLLLRLAVRCAGPEEFRQALAAPPDRPRRRKKASP
jgi:hypothetical protein